MDRSHRRRARPALGPPTHGLTRHKIDAYVVAERDRLEAAVQRRQIDVHTAASPTAVRERLFTEARSYAEKANVADYAADRIEFMRTGKIDIRPNVTSLNLGKIAQAAQRIFEAAREISSDRSLNLPIWRLTQSIRHAQRQVSQRVAEVVHAIRARIELRTKERVITQDWDISR
jgi:hypothetical protein